MRISIYEHEAIIRSTYNLTMLKIFYDAGIDISNSSFNDFHELPPEWGLEKSFDIFFYGISELFEAKLYSYEDIMQGDLSSYGDYRNTELVIIIEEKLFSEVLKSKYTNEFKSYINSFRGDYEIDSIGNELIAVSIIWLGCYHELAEVLVNKMREKAKEILLRIEGDSIVYSHNFNR